MVEIDHSGDEDNLRSCTGYIIYVQISLIDCISKK